MPRAPAAYQTHTKHADSMMHSKGNTPLQRKPDGFILVLRYSACNNRKDDVLAVVRWTKVWSFTSAVLPGARWRTESRFGWIVPASLYANPEIP